MTCANVANIPARYCGRPFAATELELIRELITTEPRLNRAELSRLVCRALGWLRPDGRTKDMACRIATLRMHRDGLITLPPPLKGNSNGRIRPEFTSAAEPRPQLVLLCHKLLGVLCVAGDTSQIRGIPTHNKQKFHRANHFYDTVVIALPAGALGELQFRHVTPQDSSLWNELIERHHYLGYTPMPGAQIRYLVFAGPHLLAALGFGHPPGKLRPVTSSLAGPIKSGRATSIAWSIMPASSSCLGLHLTIWLPAF